MRVFLLNFKLCDNRNLKYETVELRPKTTISVSDKTQN